MDRTIVEAGGIGLHKSKKAEYKQTNKYSCIYFCS